MASRALLELGRPVSCLDGPFGELADVVVDPVAKRITNLVVQPAGRPALARLAPASLVDRAGAADGIALRCTIEDLQGLPTGDDPDWDLVLETYDRVPRGEKEIRRTSVVLAADGEHLGHVAAFLVDGEEITHLVLGRGHLWPRRDVTVPVDAVAHVDDDAVTLTLSREQVGSLPAVRHRAR